MRPLSAHNILQIWEIGQSQHLLDKALTLLSFACPEQSMDELASLSIGQRDAYLLTLRELSLGNQMNGFAECPKCRERLEFTLNVADIRIIDPSKPTPQEYEFTTDGCELRFRLPNSWDLAAIVGYKEADTASQQLVQRCLLQANCEGVSVTHSELPPGVLTRLAERIAEYDPQAEVLLDLNCPACSHSWQALFDIVAFFWTELSAQAKRLLHEVHTLARFYGWREADILSMSTVRRQFYLDLVS
jgi:hypothetical protein